MACAGRLIKIAPYRAKLHELIDVLVRIDTLALKSVARVCEYNSFIVANVVGKKSVTQAVIQCTISH